jgi:hypothetical protein
MAEAGAFILVVYPKEIAAVTECQVVLRQTQERSIKKKFTQISSDGRSC